jgi:hypothetical protein
VKLFGPVLRPFDTFYVKSFGQGKAGAGSRPAFSAGILYQGVFTARLDFILTRRRRSFFPAARFLTIILAAAASGMRFCFFLREAVSHNRAQGIGAVYSFSRQSREKLYLSGQPGPAAKRQDAPEL